MDNPLGVHAVPELPPVPVTPAEGLSLLRDLTISLWIEWAGDPNDHIPMFMSVIGDVLKKPLAKFDNAYESFVDQLNANTETNHMHDLWRVFQLTFFTELGIDRERILDEFILMVRRITADSPSVEVFAIEAIQKPAGNVNTGDIEWLKSIRNNLSKLLLLIIKVYVSSVRMRELAKDPE